MHPLSKYWHLIDYIIVWRMDRQDVRATKTMYMTDRWAGHRLVVNKLNLRIQPAKQSQGRDVFYKNGCLKAESRQHEASFLNGHLQPAGRSQSQFRGPQRNFEQLEKIHKAVQSSATTIL